MAIRSGSSDLIVTSVFPQYRSEAREPYHYSNPEAKRGIAILMFNLSLRYEVLLNSTGPCRVSHNIAPSRCLGNRVPSPASRDSGFQKNPTSQSRYIRRRPGGRAWLQLLSSH